MTHKKTKALLAAAVLAGGTAGARAHIIDFFAKLDGTQVVDPTESPATGVCSIKYNHHGFTMDIRLYLEGIGKDDLKGDGPNNTPLHIHMAPVGENGPLVIDLGWWSATTFEEYEPNRLFVDWENVFIGGQQGEVWSDFAANQEALYVSQLYVDVHTNAYPDGEIRGQIYEVPTPGALAMFGAVGLLASRRRAR